MDSDDGVSSGDAGISGEIGKAFVVEIYRIST
jgi:hypothetical protein